MDGIQHKLLPNLIQTITQSLHDNEIKTSLSTTDDKIMLFKSWICPKYFWCLKYICLDSLKVAQCMTPGQGCLKEVENPKLFQKESQGFSVQAFYSLEIQEQDYFRLKKKNSTG